MTLLEKAKKISLRRYRQESSIKDEEIEVVVAFLRNQISYKQASAVLGTSAGNLPNFVLRAIRASLANGTVQLTMKKHRNSE